MVLFGLIVLNIQPSGFYLLGLPVSSLKPCLNSASLEIIEIKVCQTYSDKFFDTIYVGMCFFFQLNLLPPYLLHLQGRSKKIKVKKYIISLSDC